MGSVGRRHVCLHRGEAPALVAACVGGHALTAQEQLDAVARQASLQRLPDQRMRCAVPMTVDLDVVVDVYFDGLEACQLIGLRRQRHQGWGVQLGKHAGAAARQLLERPIVQAGQQLRNGRVHLGDAVKALVTQPRQDPAGDDLHRTLGRGLSRGVRGRAGSTDVP